MHIYIYIWTERETERYKYIYTYKYTSIDVYIYIHLYVCVFESWHICLCIYTYIYISIYVYIHVCTSLFLTSLCVYVHVIASFFWGICRHQILRHAYSSIHVYTFTYVHMWVIYVYVCVCMRMYISIFISRVCLCVCVCDCVCCFGWSSKPFREGWKACVYVCMYMNSGCVRVIASVVLGNPWWFSSPFGDSVRYIYIHMYEYVCVRVCVWLGYFPPPYTALLYQCMYVYVSEYMYLQIYSHICVCARARVCDCVCCVHLIMHEHINAFFSGMLERVGHFVTEKWHRRRKLALCSPNHHVTAIHLCT